MSLGFITFTVIVASAEAQSVALAVTTILLLPVTVAVPVIVPSSERLKPAAKNRILLCILY